MLENEQQPTENVVKHIDRCLSCLACMTTCPSGVNYMHLIDQARTYIEDNYNRPVMDKIIRVALAFLLPRPALIKISIYLSQLTKPLHKFLPEKLRIMAGFSNNMSVRTNKKISTVHKSGNKKVGLLLGCVQQAVDDRINTATISLLEKLNYEVICLYETSCCGAIEHHLGKEILSHSRIKNNVQAWMQQFENNKLEAIVVNASGCGTMIKDYGYLLRDDELLADAAKMISEKTLDISEFLMQADLSDLSIENKQLKVAYQNPCSMQHGQKIIHQPVNLLEKFGFKVETIPEDHMCCGSAGTYNLLQPKLADELGKRKAANIQSVNPDVIATGNLGCKLQLKNYSDIPIIHTVELLDWASGGNIPPSLADVEI